MSKTPPKPFDWAQYLDLARSLVEGTDSEAHRRAAVSRAYYAAFVVARNYLRDAWGQGFSSDDHVHQEVAREFARGPEYRDGNAIAENLRLLRVARNSADYDDTLPDVGTVASRALYRARFVIDKVRAQPPR